MMKQFDDICVVLQSPAIIENNGVDFMLDRTNELPQPFIRMLDMRWCHAAKSAPFPVSITGKISPSPRTLFITSDHVAKHKSVWECAVSDLENVGSQLIKFGACAEANYKGMLRGDHNLFSSKRLGKFGHETSFYYDVLQKANNNDLVTVPLGCGTDWLPTIDHTKKSIFLDEPHKQVIDNLKNRDLQHVFSFFRSLEICEVLASRGFEICTFARTESEELVEVYKEFPFLNVIGVGSWIPLRRLLEYYGEHSLFFNFFQETHGFPVYENLQMGNAGIVFAENFNPFVIRQMQTGVALSLYSDPTVSASIVEDFFQRYVTCGLREQIRSEATKLYSADTFFPRLDSALKLSASLRKS